ncbi:MAG: hypothetical protein ACLFUO_05075 [Candidatus Woesearchaeota archaeon]
MALKYAPLPSSTLLIAIFGFFISTVYLMNRWPSMAFAFMIVFIMMGISSFISMARADAEAIFALDKFERTNKDGHIVESKTEKEVEKLLHINKK